MTTTTTEAAMTRKPMTEQCGFTTTDHGVTCDTCGQSFPRADGSVMRSHAKRVHGVVVYVPARCNA